MEMNFYQVAAMRTRGQVKTLNESLVAGALGVSGEAGEVTDYIKKVIFHGHELDREKLAKELGDVMWYIALLAESIGIDMDTIAQMNIDKLMKRYPDGFNTRSSIHRPE